MTIREFAALCGLSPSTVSRYFTGRGAMSDETARLIAQMVQKTGYQPPEGYRSRRKTGVNIVALLPHFRPAFFSDVLDELHAEAERRGKRLLVLTMDMNDPSSTLSALNELAPLGVILLHEATEDPVADALSRRRLPVVVCSGLAMGRRFSAVHIDDMMAAYDAAKYLISLGHCRIGALADNSRAISSGFQRITGFKKAMEDARLAPDAIEQISLSFEGGYQGMKDLLAAHPDLTAVFAFSDDAAAGAITCLQDQGLRVPEDISVMGFDDNSRAEQIRPRLTTVHQSIRQLAEKSIERLLEGGDEVQTLTLPYSIVQRESCAPPHKTKEAL